MKYTLKGIPQIIYATIFIICIFASCGNEGKKATDEGAGPEMQIMSENYVDTMKLTVSPFVKQVVCNGRLSPHEKSDLRFESDGITLQLHVKEGQHVAKGQLIATLDKDRRTRELEKAEHDLYRAEMELADKLIGLGYDIDMKNVPDDIMRRAEVTSGYYSANYQLEEARRMLDCCDLRAPFAGCVANLDAKTHQKSDRVCTLIDDSSFNVEFRVLEAELDMVREGSVLKVSPFVAEDRVIKGVVTGINPQVDEKGLVKVTAALTGTDTSLIDGMNVRVTVEENIGDMFVVPKDAVVERDGFHVIFRYDDGRAVWTYVDIVHSNINSFAITGCARKETTIGEGDIVITSGNLNLADGTEVKLR
ncbi:MAG: HlyD family efflux transporter periplasmic adaptor subunit [Muribaculaceae bacterium]|nr:HlyD family efflux transporter periplasmic adaptor subunit [Muribaculaceae bacterium]